MLLNELMGVKRFHKYTEYQLEKLLSRYGIKFLAAGKYGRVFSHDRWNYVVKIFEDDPSYLAFAEYARKHPNKHFPRIQRKPLEMHAFTRRSRSSAGKFWIVKIEKLQEITDQNLKKFLAESVEHFMSVWHWKYGDHGRQDLKDALHAKNEHHSQMLPDGTFKKGMSANDLFEMYPWFESLCGAADEINEHVGANDLRNGSNYMMRHDGTIVITDPAWEGYNPYRAAAEYMATELDYHGANDHEHENEISGPAYLKKNQQPEVQAVRTFVAQLDDIPF